jgi:hypothetical protein
MAMISNTSFHSEAFVHGIMDGEFIEKDPMTEDFTLC